MKISFRSSLALPLLLATMSGCSSVPDPAGAGTDTPAAPSPSRTQADAREAARVRDFLAGRYAPSDVRHSFRADGGEMIDCVDFFAAPGVKAMAARGKPITSIPKPPPLPDVMKKKDAEVARRAVRGPDPSFHGQPDIDGNAQECPAGSYPETRITAEQIIAAGGLDAFVRPFVTKGPPPDPSATCGADTSGYAHVVSTLFDGSTPGVQYGSSSMAIYDPTIPWQAQPKDHSLSQVWMYTGTNLASSSPNGICTSDCVQSIEVGWTVDPAINGGDARPHLFIFSTSNGYGNGCYDNTQLLGEGACVPWIPSSGAYSFGASLPFNPPGNTGGQDPQPLPVELTTTVIDIAGDYWITVQAGSGPSAYIGYFPGSNYSQAFDTFQVGGEIYDNTGAYVNSGVAMGSGNPPNEGVGWAAYHHDYSAAAYVNGQTTWAGNGTICATRPADYSYTAPAQTGWSNDFYYGGDPTCTPTTCKANGDTCGSIDDGCGTTLNCGSCRARQVCLGNKRCINEL